VQIFTAIFPATISAAQVFPATVGTESNYTVFTTISTQLIAFAIYLNGVFQTSPFPDNLRSVRTDFSTYSVLWTPSNSSERLQLHVFGYTIYNGETTAWSLFQPQVQLCNCQNGGTCTTSQYDYPFVLLECLCTPGK